MGLARHLIVALVSASLTFGTSDGASALVCRLLCFLEACPLTSPQAPSEDCCPRRDPAPASKCGGGGDADCPCARSPERVPHASPATSPGSGTFHLLLLAGWISERTSAGFSQGLEHACPARGAAPPGSLDEPGGCLGRNGRLAFGGSWSASVLGCARI